MNVEFLNRWLSWAAIALPLLTVVASAGALYTRSILNARAAAELDSLKPWRLSADQRTKLTEELRLLPAGRVVFSHRLMDGDGRDFAEELAAAFEAVGWSLGGIGGSSLNDLPGRVTVAIAAESAESLLQTTDRVCDAMNKAGVSCGGDLQPNSLGGPLERDTLYVVIGRKPPRL